MQNGTTPPHILTVEDDESLRASVVAWLEDAGYTVSEAGDAHRALEIIQRGPPDLILLDLGIPGISGEDLLAMLNDRHPGLPVVVVSGRADIGDAIAAFRLGAWDYLTKPLPDLDMLGVTITNCLERKRLRTLLHSAEMRYQELVHHLPVLVFALDEGLNLTFINNSVRSLLGWSAHEALAVPGWFVANLHPDDAPQVRAAFTQALRSPAGAFGLEFRFMHSGGYPVPLQARFTYEPSPRPDSGMPGRIEGVLVDLTERMFIERLLGQQTRLNTLAAVTDEVAHEFRNPVFALAGFARALKRRCPEAPEADVILEEAAKLEGLIDGIHARLMPVAHPHRPCRLDEVAGFCVDMMRPIAMRRAFRLGFEAAPDLPPVVTDEDLVAQLLLALLTTAFDNGSPGGLTQIAIHPGEGGQRLTVSFPPATTHAQAEVDDVSGYACSLAVAYRLASRLGFALTTDKDDGTTSFILDVPEHPVTTPESRQ